MARKLKIVFGLIAFFAFCVVPVSAHLFDGGSISASHAATYELLGFAIAVVAMICYRKMDKILEENQWLKK